MMEVIKKLCVGLAICCLIQTNVGAAEVAKTEEAGATTAAQQVATTPHQLVEKVTSEMLTTIIEHRDDFDNNPAPLIDKMNQLLDQLVDFTWIATNVMGPYRKGASLEQHQRFAETFRHSLVETYSRGMLTYSDEKILLIPPKNELGDSRKVVVSQEIHGAKDIYPLKYTMAKNRQGEWKILNVVINGINLGKTFRNQFVQAVE